MRGTCSGTHFGRAYLHSAITEALWYAVAESERLFMAKLSHGVMLASLYGNPDSNLSDGNDQIHEMYLGALGAIPYFGVATRTRRTSSKADELVKEWRRLNTKPAEGEEG